MSEQQSVSVPTLGPIPTTPFPISSLEVAPNKGRRLDCHIDLEGSGGTLQTVSGVCAIGLLGIDSETRREIIAYEVAIEPLVKDDPVQIASYWEKPENKASWQRIVDARRPRLEVIQEFKDIVHRLKELGWSVHLFARPACYDFRELTALFETSGIERLANNQSFWNGLLAPRMILQQAITGFPLDGTVEEDSRGTMVSPFGFGGASQVTCIGQVMIGMSMVLGMKPQPFNEIMRRVIGRSVLAHGGLQDARDQAATWYAVLDALKDRDTLVNLLA